MKSRLIFALVVGVVVTVVWLQREGRQAEDLGGEVLAASIARISQLDGYEDNKDRIVQAITQAHEQAFSFSYEYGSPGRRGRRREAATFDETEYLKWLFFNLTRELRRAIDDVPTRTEMAQLAKFRERVDELRKELGLPETPGQ